LRVGADETHPLAKAIPDEQREFCRRRGLAGPLKPRQKNDSGRLMPEVQFGDTITQCLGEFFVKDSDEHLPRRQTAQDIGAKSTLPYQFDKVTNHRQSDVRFDQGTPDIPNSILDVVLSQAPSAANLIEYATQAIT
jgi:hypothetical protein